jgi:lauroyl/myristoyl acyltransferase
MMCGAEQRTFPRPKGKWKEYTMPRLQDFVANSSLGIRLALAFGRMVPPRVGIPLAQRLADIIATQQGWALVQAVRLNQWVARGEISSESELNDAVRLTLRNQARALYVLARYLARPAEMECQMVLPDEMLELIERSRQQVPGQGLMLVGIHLSNFDLALHAIARRGIHCLAITISELPGGYQLQYNLRRSSGLELKLATSSTFRQAFNCLQAGGYVVTGIDRPIPQPKHMPRFFGHPSALPVHHIHMALKASVPIVLLATHQKADGKYYMSVSQPIEMQPEANRDDSILSNAERLLAIAEGYIRATPEQWAQFIPVWPDVHVDLSR